MSWDSRWSSWARTRQCTSCLSSDPPSRQIDLHLPWLTCQLSFYIFVEDIADQFVSRQDGIHVGLCLGRVHPALAYTAASFPPALLPQCHQSLPPDTIAGSTPPSAEIDHHPGQIRAPLSPVSVASLTKSRQYADRFDLAVTSALRSWVSCTG